MSEPALWARRGSVELHWKLGGLDTAPPARALLVGWDDDGAVDSGVPAVIAGVCARALAATARVAFLRSDTAAERSPEWVDRGGECARSAPAPSWLESVVARLRGRHGPVTLICASRAETIQGAFTDAHFTWWSQSQVLLLSARDAPPPAIKPVEALALLDPDWVTRAAPLSHQGVLAVARPAVDGDALGVLALDDGIIDRLLAALAHECHAAAVGWALRD